MKYLDFDQMAGGCPLRHRSASLGAEPTRALFSTWRFARLEKEIFRKNT
jgi:hypothetical protein